MKRHPLHRLSLSIMGNRSSALENARARLVILSAAFVLAYLVVAVRLFDLMILQGFFLQTDMEEKISAYQSAPTHSERRADILDRNDVLLATSLKTSSLYADPKLVVDPVGTAKRLSEIFPEESYDVLLQKLQKKGRFVWLKRNLVPDDQSEVMRIGDPGLAFREEYKRVYPQGELAAHLVGYATQDNKGMAGLERGFDSLLTKMPDNALRLTLDIRVQHALRQEIAATIDKFSAKAGTGIIMDINSGEVLAMTSLPDFDPHLNTMPDDQQLFNRATLGVYELGSVFKIFTTAALLEKDENALSQTFDAREPLKRGRFTIKDYHAEKRVMTVPEVFMVSSNIGTALMGEELGTENMKAFYKKLGLFDKPDIALKEVGSPLYPRPWRDINTLTASYGHGVAVSPMQLITAVSTVSNGGYKLKPGFVLNEAGTGKKSERVLERLVSEETSKVMRGLLRLVVTDGTGKNADVEGYEVGGKTGTAEKPGIKGYDKDKLISSFVGVFPASHPKYSIFVVIDEPKGIKESYGYATAGWTAAPTAGRVVQRMATILGMPPVEATAEPVEKLLVSQEGAQGL